MLREIVFYTIGEVLNVEMRKKQGKTMDKEEDDVEIIINQVAKEADLSLRAVKFTKSGTKPEGNNLPKSYLRGRPRNPYPNDYEILLLEYQVNEDSKSLPKGLDNA
ncbi:hypothetical protein HAX54_051485 [Datura stramonium]|uniref:Uncharacterized protein n=1 Tax=Datura stramonium TaxID=4076 RepID=A0ABS8SXP6_DATST|nr:hypothetical protein [Datura stramonium]